ncbi:MAG: hypothetical protein JWR26_2127 [Pedosphaera sp.]|nr:hypothetical protein [Pedosphaera sp.]
MKILGKKSNSGSVLVTTLLVTSAIVIVLGSCLLLLASRNRITVRSQSWNCALPLLEAGIEEAFSHLHDDSSSSLTNNSWTLRTIGGQSVYTKQRSFTDGSYFYVTIYNATSNNPIIYSQGFVPAPLSTNQYISRMVQVMTTNPATFTKAIAAKGIVNLSGSAVVDSFNSSDPSHSTNGMYAASLHSANGGVVTDSTATPAINVGTADIYGRTDTGAGGTVTTSGSGSVGDVGWVSGIEPGWASSDMNVTYPDQTAPAGYAGWVAPASGSYTYGGTNGYKYMLGSGNYTQSGAFTLSATDKTIVTGNATLVVTGDINIGGNSFIYLAPGASLKLYAMGATTIITGGGLANGTGLAANFSYIGLPSNTSVTYTGNSALIGTVNAPEAAFTLSGTAGMCGAAIVLNFTGSGNASIHYDEALGGNGLLAMISYREL